MLQLQTLHRRQQLVPNRLNRLLKRPTLLGRLMLLHALPAYSQEMHKCLPGRTGAMLQGTRPLNGPHGPGLGSIIHGEVLGQCGAEIKQVLVQGDVVFGGEGGREGEAADLGDGVCG